MISDRKTSVLSLIFVPTDTLVGTSYSPSSAGTTEASWNDGATYGATAAGGALPPSQTAAQAVSTPTSARARVLRR